MLVASNTRRARIPAPTTNPWVREVLSGHADATSVTLNTGSGTLSTDVLVCIHGADFSTAAAMTTPTAGTWALAATGDNGADSYHVKVWTRTADAGANAVTVPAVGSADNFQILLVVAGADTSNPVDAAAGSNGAASTSHVAPAVSPTSSDALLIAAAIGALCNYDAPADLVERAEEDSNFSTLTAAVIPLGASGSTGTKTFTSSVSSAFATATVAIRSPAAPAGPSGPGLAPQRSTTTDTTRKQSSAPGATPQRSATLDTGLKQGAGVGASLAHTSTQDTTRKQAAGAGTSPARANTSSSGTRGIPSGPGATVQHSAVSATGSKVADGTGRPSARVGTAAVGLKQSSAPGATPQYASTLDTGFKQGVGTGTASTCSVTGATTTGIVGGAGAVVARPTTSATGRRSGAGAAASFTHPVTEGWGVLGASGGALVGCPVVTSSSVPSVDPITLRPDSGDTVRPDTGLTLRPVTTLTVRP